MTGAPRDIAAPVPAPAPFAARLRDEALFGRLPLLRGEREYSTKGILATGFTYAVAAWCFLIGGYAANVVGAVQGVVALIAGCVLGVTLSAGASALACNRYGLEQIDYTKSCFGQKGAKVILIFYVINQIGWTGMILVMFGRGVANVATALGAAAGPWLVRVAVGAGVVAAYAIVVRGVHILNVFNAIVTPGLVLVTGLLFYVILRDGGWAAVVQRPPLEPAPDARLGYVLALEYGLGAGFSWWPGIGYLARNTDTQRNSLYPQILTMGLAMGVVCCTGLLAGLLYRSYDPTLWMLKVGGPIFGVMALALVGDRQRVGLGDHDVDRGAGLPTSGLRAGVPQAALAGAQRVRVHSRAGLRRGARAAVRRRVGLPGLQRDDVRADLRRAAGRLSAAAPRPAEPVADLRGRARGSLPLSRRPQPRGARLRACSASCSTSGCSTRSA